MLYKVYTNNMSIQRGYYKVTGEAVPLYKYTYERITNDPNLFLTEDIESNITANIHDVFVGQDLYQYRVINKELVSEDCDIRSEKEEPITEQFKTFIQQYEKEITDLI